MGRIGVLVVVLGCAMAAEAHADKPVVGIMDLAVEGSATHDDMDMFVAARLTTGMRAEASKPDGAYQLSKHSPRLLDQWLLSDCRKRTTRCIASAAAELSMDFVIFGTVVRKDNGYLVTAHFVDVARRRIVRTKERVIPLSDI